MMQGKTERFEMRLDPDTLDRVDQWRARQSDLPSRAEAIRRLIEGGLSPTPDQPRISDGEKLILFMLGDLYKGFKVKGQVDPAFVAEALSGGHYWGLKWKYSGIFHGHEDSDQIRSEVADVLDMWDFIESGYAKLSAADKAQIEKDASPFGDYVRFRGFDGNNETEHLAIARFLIDELDRFSVFAGRDLNSHIPSIDTYRRMVRVFEPMRRSLTGRRLNAAEITRLLQEMIHPEHRDKQAR